MSFPLFFPVLCLPCCLLLGSPFALFDSKVVAGQEACRLAGAIDEEGNCLTFSLLLLIFAADRGRRQEVSSKSTVFFFV